MRHISIDIDTKVRALPSVVADFEEEEFAYKKHILEQELQHLLELAKELRKSLKEKLDS